MIYLNITYILTYLLILDEFCDPANSGNVKCTTESFEPIPIAAGTTVTLPSKPTGVLLNVLILHMKCTLKHLREIFSRMLRRLFSLKKLHSRLLIKYVLKTLLHCVLKRILVKFRLYYVIGSH